MNTQTTYPISEKEITSAYYEIQKKKEDLAKQLKSKSPEELGVSADSLEALFTEKYRNKLVTNQATLNAYTKIYTAEIEAAIEKHQNTQEQTCQLRITQTGIHDN